MLLSFDNHVIYSMSFFKEEGAKRLFPSSFKNYSSPTNSTLTLGVLDNQRLTS
jgi:hypothetical protein